MVAVSWGLHKPEVLKASGADFSVCKASEILKIVDKN